MLSINPLFPESFIETYGLRCFIAGQPQQMTANFVWLMMY